MIKESNASKLRKPLLEENFLAVSNVVDGFQQHIIADYTQHVVNMQRAMLTMFEVQPSRMRPTTPPPPTKVVYSSSIPPHLL